MEKASERKMYRKQDYTADFTFQKRHHVRLFCKKFSPFPVHYCVRGMKVQKCWWAKKKPQLKAACECLRLHTKEDLSRSGSGTSLPSS